MIGIKNEKDFRAQRAAYLALRTKQERAKRSTWSEASIKMSQIGDALVHYSVTAFEGGEADYKTASNALPTEYTRDLFITALIHKGYNVRDLLTQ